MFAAALVTFASFVLLMSHLSPRSMRRLVGYKGLVDLVLHSTVIFMFFGTSTDGLLQAEAAAILFSISLRVYRWAAGYERINGGRWCRFAGRFT